MKVWITGSRGFVGSALTKTLRKHNFRVTCITNSWPAQEGACHVDYEKRESIRSVLSSTETPDVLFHLGWGNVYEPESSVHLDQNLSNTKNLLDELYENGLQTAVLIGSSSEYGSREGRLSETDVPTGRLTKYAQGKIAACRYGFEVASAHQKIFVHVRLTHALGADNRQNSLINQLYKSYCDSTVLGLTDCEQFRDYVYISDVVEGLMRISSLRCSEVLNLGGGVKIELKELIKLFWDKLGAPIELLRFGARERPVDEPVQPPCFVSLEKLRRLTNWQPSIPIEEAVSRTIDDLKRRS